MTWNHTTRFGLVAALGLLAGTSAAADDKPSAVTLGDPSLTAGIPGEGALTIDEIRAWLDDPENHEVLDVTLPLGLAAGESQVVGLDENPMTRAKIELGRQLFFDPRLSSNATISCATCHDPSMGYASRTRFGVGILDQEGTRNTPTSYNRIFSAEQFWDGRAATLEEQAKGPIANPVEMTIETVLDAAHEAAVSRLKGIPGYVLQFEVIFPDEGLTIDTVAKAIADFERAIVTGPSPYDYAQDFEKFAALPPEELEDIEEFEPELYEQYLSAKAAVEANPMSEGARRGQELFFSERVNCSACHVGANLTDELYHNLGIGIDPIEPHLGRYEVTHDPKDWGAFKTPTIRNIAQTAPYMHDGSLETLLEVVEHYDKGGNPNKNLSDKIVPLDLTEQEKLDLVAFMESCTGALPEVETGRLPE